MRLHLSHLSVALLATLTPPAFADSVPTHAQQIPVQPTDLPVDGSEQVLQLEQTRILGTAEQALKQAPGVSIITAEDISKRPPANDLSEIIRREPGVNLTGNSASGNRGNNRQIDLRGMGPENTLILIDGKPSSSRNAVRYGWNGDRDTRGETNWVPAEEVERVEILRGPAAARYGSGAMGGVVNIITKRPSDELHGSMTVYALQPQDSAEGAGKRANFNLSGPLSQELIFRLYGSTNKTDADDANINSSHQADPGSLVAGREGVRNKDVNGLLSWTLDPENTVDLEASYSRQGNIYTGDTMNNVGSDFVSSQLGKESNVLHRSSFGLTHHGDYQWGSSQSSLTYDFTRNNRLREGLAGGPEGAPNGAGRFESRLRNTRAASEINLPLSWGAEQVLTLGGEYLYESMSDPGALSSQSFDSTGGAAGALGVDRSTDKITARSFALFVEDNIEATADTLITPGLRYDHHQSFGDNFSPSLNASHKLTDHLTLKGGIARAYKSPNLYQSNPNYLLYSRGQGCSIAQSNNGGCYLVGNENLVPEISVNKEIGLAYDQANWRTSATYFRNDYKNKIVGGVDPLYRLNSGARVLRWENSGKAVVEGIEGNLFVALTPELDWNTNLTYMIESENRDTGEPLSVIPKYTLNTTLDWQASEKLSFQANATWFGKQEAPSLNTRTSAVYDDLAQQDVAPYAVAGLSSGYAFNKHLSVRVGVNNLFDKRQYREGGASAAGAQTYNEPGRAYFASVTTSF